MYVWNIDRCYKTNGNLSSFVNFIFINWYQMAYQYIGWEDATQSILENWIIRLENYDPNDEIMQV